MLRSRSWLGFTFASAAGGCHPHSVFLGSATPSCIGGRLLCFWWLAYHRAICASIRHFYDGRRVSRGLRLRRMPAVYLRCFGTKQVGVSATDVADYGERGFGIVHKPSNVDRAGYAIGGLPLIRLAMGIGSRLASFASCPAGMVNRADVRVPPTPVGGCPVARWPEFGSCSARNLAGNPG